MDNYRSSSDGLIIGAVALIFFIMIFVGISMSMRGPSQCGLYGHRAPKYLSLNPNQAGETGLGFIKPPTLEIVDDEPKQTLITDLSVQEQKDVLNLVRPELTEQQRELLRQRFIQTFGPPRDTENRHTKLTNEQRKDVLNLTRPDLTSTAKENLAKTGPTSSTKETSLTTTKKKEIVELTRPDLKNHEKQTLVNNTPIKSESNPVTSERRRDRLQVADTKPLVSETLQGDRVKKSNVTSTGRGGSQVQLSKAIGRGVTGETGVADTIRRNEEIRKQNLNMDNVRTETSFKKARLAGKIGILNEKHPEFLQNTNYSPDNAYNIATSLITDEGPLDSYFRNLDCSQFGAKDFVPDFHPCNEKLRQESQKRMEILNTRANEGFVRRAVVDTVAPFRGPVGRAIEGPRRFV